MKIIILLACMAVAACSSKPKRSVAEPEWYGRMHKLSTTYLNLTPLTANPRSFLEPRNQFELDAGLKRLSDIAAEVSHDPQAPNADPVIEFSAKNFAQYSREAYSAYKNGDFAWTKFALKRAGDQCIACHTRADRGAKDYPLSWKPQLFSLNRTQRIQFWLANRQYSLAMAEAQNLAMNEAEVIADPIEWLNALQKVMTMVVRVEENVRFAEMLTQNTLNNQMVPFYIRSDLLEWRRDIQFWKTQPSPREERVRLKMAQNLLKNQSLVQRPARARFIANLRASSILHQLSENSKFPLYPDVLESLGAAEENLGAYALGQHYYEACIHAMPHSTLAERCYSKLYVSLRETNPFLESDPSGQQATQNNLEFLRTLAAPTKELEKDRSKIDRGDDVLD